MRRGRLRNTKPNIFCLHLLSPLFWFLPLFAMCVVVERGCKCPRHRAVRNPGYCSFLIYCTWGGGCVIFGRAPSCPSAIPHLIYHATQHPHFTPAPALLLLPPFSRAWLLLTHPPSHSHDLPPFSPLPFLLYRVLIAARVT